MSITRQQRPRVTSAEQIVVAGGTVPLGINTIAFWDATVWAPTASGEMEQAGPEVVEYWDGVSICAITAPKYLPQPLPGLAGRIINLTSKEVKVMVGDAVETLPSSGHIVLAFENDTRVEQYVLPGVVVVSKVYAPPTGLPPVGVPVLITAAAAAGCIGRKLTYTAGKVPAGGYDHCSNLVAA